MLSKYHKISSAVVAIGLVVVVQAFASPFPIFRYLVPALCLFVAVVLLYNYFYLREQGKWNYWKAIQTGLFFAAWFGIFLLLPNYFIRGVYLVVSLPVVYAVESLVSNFGEQILINQVLLTGFGLFVSVWGMQFYYSLSESYIFILELVVIFLLVRSSLEYIPHSPRLKNISALALALFIAQLHWALGFLPLHYSALAIILFSLFYMIWTLYYYALFNILTAKRIQFYLLFVIVAIAIVVFATPWTVVA